MHLRKLIRLAGVLLFVAGFLLLLNPVSRAAPLQNTTTSTAADKDADNDSKAPAAASGNSNSAVPHRDEPLAYVIELNSAITPATFDYIKRGLLTAEKAHADIVVIEMQTPGGLYDSMQEIIQAILDSPVPVATYVSPSGSRAASAGTYILYASHIAAMAPGTNIGAATPINMLDEDKNPPPGSTPGPKTTLELKMVNDAAAYIRGLAELRNRNGEWAERAVRQSESLDASEALAKKAVDLIANDVPDLLAKVDGRNVKMGQDKTLKLRTKGATIVTVTPDWRMKLLDIVATPNVAFLLMTIGTYALIFEIFHPGMVVPGVIGVICLTLGLFAMNILPINYAGLALLIVGVGLMAGEAFAPGIGALGIGGAISFAVGATMLFNSNDPSFAIDPWMIAGVTLGSLAFLSGMLALAFRAQRRPVTTGVEALKNATAEVVRWSQGKGDVRVAGEIWKASAPPEFILNPGDKVKVVEIDGLQLVVKPE